jgi:hypothetical protein
VRGDQRRPLPSVVRHHRVSNMSNSRSRAREEERRHLVRRRALSPSCGRSRRTRRGALHRERRPTQIPTKRGALPSSVEREQQRESDQHRPQPRKAWDHRMSSTSSSQSRVCEEGRRHTTRGDQHWPRPGKTRGRRALSTSSSQSRHRPHPSEARRHRASRARAAITAEHPKKGGTMP